MSKPRAVAKGFVLGLVAFVGACAATVDDPVVDGEDVDATEEALDIAARLPPRLPLRLVPRILRMNPIDPGGRLLHCLPDPRKEYLSRDPEDCARIRFYCDPGIPFFDSCGCGCEVSLSE